MITTNEAIGEPVAFLEADPSLVYDTYNDSNRHLIVTGPDIDMHVGFTQGSAGEDFGESRKNICKVLGELYMRGRAQGFIAMKNVYVEWYPSPTHVNELVERLGLRPGEDVLRFVHTAHDKIPPSVYGNHLSLGEYPQSVGPRQFSHDRDDDHAPGVILMPPTLTKAIVEISIDTLSHPEAFNVRKKHRNGKSSLVDDLAEKIDRSTAYVATHANIDLDELSDLAAGDRICSIPRPKLHGLSFEQMFWQDEAKRQAAIKQGRVTLRGVILEHLLELKPVIEAAQAELNAAA